MQVRAVEARKPPSLLTTGLTLAFAGILVFSKGEHAPSPGLKKCSDEHDKAQKSFRQEHGYFVSEPERLKYLGIIDRYRTCLKAAGNSAAKQKTAHVTNNTNSNGVIYDFK